MPKAIRSSVSQSKSTGTQTEMEFTHPVMRDVKIIMTDDTEFYVKMAVPEDRVSIRLASCPRSHHAWQGYQGKVSATQVQKFRNKFGIKTK
jgi:ribosomal protein L31